MSQSNWYARYHNGIYKLSGPLDLLKEVQGLIAAGVIDYSSNNTDNIELMVAPGDGGIMRETPIVVDKEMFQVKLYNDNSDFIVDRALTVEFAYNTGPKGVHGDECLASVLWMYARMCGMKAGSRYVVYDTSTVRAKFAEAVSIDPDNLFGYRPEAYVHSESVLLLGAEGFYASRGGAESAVARAVAESSIPVECDLKEVFRESISDVVHRTWEEIGLN